MGMWITDDDLDFFDDTFYSGPSFNESKPGEDIGKKYREEKFKYIQNLIKTRQEKEQNLLKGEDFRYEESTLLEDIGVSHARALGRAAGEVAGLAVTAEKFSKMASPTGVVQVGIEVAPKLHDKLESYGRLEEGPTLGDSLAAAGGYAWDALGAQQETSDAVAKFASDTYKNKMGITADTDMAEAYGDFGGYAVDMLAPYGKVVDVFTGGVGLARRGFKIASKTMTPAQLAELAEYTNRPGVKNVIDSIKDAKEYAQFERLRDSRESAIRGVLGKIYGEDLAKQGWFIDDAGSVLPLKAKARGGVEILRTKAAKLDEALLEQVNNATPYAFESVEELRWAIGSRQAQRGIVTPELYVEWMLLKDAAIKAGQLTRKQARRIIEIEKLGPSKLAQHEKEMGIIANAMDNPTAYDSMDEAAEALKKGTYGGSTDANMARYGDTSNPGGVAAAPADELEAMTEQVVKRGVSNWLRPIRHVLHDMGGIGKLLSRDFQKTRTISQAMQGNKLQHFSNYRKILDDDSKDVIKAMLDGAITPQQAQQLGYDNAVIRAYYHIRALMDQQWKHVEWLRKNKPDAVKKIGPYIDDYFPHTSTNFNTAQLHKKIYRPGDRATVIQEWKKRETTLAHNAVEGDLFDVLARYTSDTSDDLAFRQVFGKGLDEVDTIRDLAVAAATAVKHSEEQIAFIGDTFEAMFKYASRDLYNGWDEALTTMREAQVILKLPLAATRNLTQSGITIAITDARDVAKAMKVYAAGKAKGDLTQFNKLVNDVGVFADSVIYDSIAQDATGILTGTMRTVLDVSQFNRAELFNRGIASWAGKFYAERQVGELMKINRDIAQAITTKEGRAIAEELSEMGVDVGRLIVNKGTLHADDTVSAAAWSVRNSQYTSKAEEFSLQWAKGVHNRKWGNVLETLVLQFKSFPFKTVNTFWQNSMRKIMNDPRKVYRATQTAMGIFAGGTMGVGATFLNQVVSGKRALYSPETGEFFYNEMESGQDNAKARVFFDACTNMLAVDAMSYNVSGVLLEGKGYLRKRTLESMAWGFLASPTSSDIADIWDATHKKGSSENPLSSLVGISTVTRGLANAGDPFSNPFHKFRGPDEDLANFWAELEASQGLLEDD